MLIAALEVAIAGLPIILGSAVAGAGVQQDDLSVRSFAQRLALTANDAKLDRWQTEVDHGIASFQDGLKKGYPAKPTRECCYCSFLTLFRARSPVFTAFFCLALCTVDTVNSV